jgi:hypothetical protein
MYILPLLFSSIYFTGRRGYFDSVSESKYFENINADMPLTLKAQI